MGKATRWLKGLLGMKKDKENVENNSTYGEKKEKRRWSFVKSGKDSGGLTQIPETDGAWMRSYIDETAKEKNKHAIAVAAATAAVADAAVAAAQAAVAVVRLTSHGRGGLFHGGRERWAAIKIQTVFRGFLARKALRALRGLVKLQALVRGFLVRKRAASTLYSMEALIRAQTAVRYQRNRRSISNDYRFQPEMRARKSIETRSEFHSKRISASYDLSHYAFDENSKIVEVDPHNPGSRSRSRSRRMNACVSQCCDDRYYQGIPSPLRVRLSIPDHRRCYQDFDWSFLAEDYKFPTAQSTPRFVTCGRANGPVTPTKSVCGDGFFKQYSNCPNYMSNTHSFRAKLRSLSAPKQRPDSGPKKRLSLNEIMASRTSFTGVRMQRASSQVQQDFD